MGSTAIVTSAGVSSLKAGDLERIIAWGRRWRAWAEALRVVGRWAE